MYNNNIMMNSFGKTQRSSVPTMILNKTKCPKLRLSSNITNEPYKIMERDKNLSRNSNTRKHDSLIIRSLLSPIAKFRVKKRKGSLIFHKGNLWKSPLVLPISRINKHNMRNHSRITNGINDVNEESLNKVLQIESKKPNLRISKNNMQSKLPCVAPLSVSHKSQKLLFPIIDMNCKPITAGCIIMRMKKIKIS